MRTLPDALSQTLPPNCTVLIGSPSYRSCGQIAVEVMVHTLKYQRMGAGWSEWILPVVGAESAAAIEVYYHEPSATIAIQIRSIVTRAQEFARDLWSLVVQWRPSQVVVLAGCPASLLSDNWREQSAIAWNSLPECEAASVEECAVAIALYDLAAQASSNLFIQPCAENDPRTVISAVKLIAGALSEHASHHGVKWQIPASLSAEM